VLCSYLQSLCCAKRKAYEPCGPSGRSLSRFLWHEVTKNTSSPPWMGCYSIAGLPPALSSLAPIYTPAWREALREVKCLAQEHNNMSSARARTWTPGSGSEHTSHKATTPSTCFRVGEKLSDKRHKFAH